MPPDETVTVELDGARHAVPAGLTVLAALWHAGLPTVRGAGCLGGACGACTVSWRLPGETATRTGLGCQTVVRDGMAVTRLAIDPPSRPAYRADDPADPAEALFALHPETRRCTLCDACTQVCPQDIPVRRTVRQMMNGDFAAVAPAFDSCVMCGLCAFVCEVGIAPQLLGLFARRAVGRGTPAPEALRRGMAAVTSGAHGPAWDELLGGGPEGLEARCRAAREPGSPRRGAR